MKIYIDGDSCPKRLLNWLVEQEAQQAWSLIIVSDQSRTWDQQFQSFLHTLPVGKESTDQWIISQVNSGDLLITRDFLLAEKILNRQAKVFNPKGLQFTQEYLKMRIQESQISLALSRGGHKKNKKKTIYSSQDLKDFQKSYSQWIEEYNSEDS